jgi:mono/diheme cytochrome c family protein
MRGSFLYGATPSLAVLMSLIAAGAWGQEDVGDPEAGFVVASEICASCHAITREQAMLPVLEGPRFDDVADTPGMTPMALFVWMRTSHPTMPNIILAPDEVRNVVAYILSLKHRQ